MGACQTVLNGRLDGSSAGNAKRSQFTECSSPPCSAMLALVSDFRMHAKVGLSQLSEGQTVWEMMVALLVDT
jgi:hypothetical protein